MVDFQSWYRIYQFGYTHTEVREGCKYLRDMKHEAGRQLFPSRADRPVHDCRHEVAKATSDARDWEAQLLAKELRASGKDIQKLHSAAENRVGPQEVRVKRPEPLLFVLGTLGTGKGEFQFPRGLASSPISDLFVADSLNHRVQCFNQCGVFRHKFGTMGSGPGEFKEPTDVAIFPNEDVAVADRRNCRIQVLTSKGEYKFHFKTMFEPFSLAIDKDFNIVVSSTNRTIEIYRRNGTGVGYFPLLKCGTSDLCCPAQVCLNSKGEIVISDPKDDVVAFYNFQGELLYKFQPKPCGPTLVMKPSGISVDSGDRIVVADALNHTVNLYTERGVFIRRIVGPSDGVGTVAACCVGSEGHLLISEFSVTGPHAVKMFRFEPCPCHVDRPPSAKRKPTPTVVDDDLL